jgi:aminoglycoside 3-N-acetyltransferase
MISFHDLAVGLRELEVEAGAPVIAHASLSAFGEVSGGAEAVVGALLAGFDALLMPAFTYQTMLVPEVGPPDNGLTYGSRRENNALAEFYRPDLPVHPTIGAVSEALRRHPKAFRSTHPILSFCGTNVQAMLETQSLDDPMAPIGAMAQAGGWMLLLGANHLADTCLHYAERLAGRKQFVRWALTPGGVVECPNFPGCSYGFQAVATRLGALTRWARVGNAEIQAIPMAGLIDTAQTMIQSDPLALLCEREGCERCQAVREEVKRR